MQDINTIDDEKKLDKLFDKYNMTCTQWNDWCFRGVPNVDYGLYPKVWRKTKTGQPLDIEKLFDEFRKLISEEAVNEVRARFVVCKQYPGCEDLNIENLIKWHFYICFENYLLGNFYKYANATGLRVANEDLELSHTSDNKKYRPKILLSRNYWPNVLSRHDEIMKEYGEAVKGKKGKLGLWGAAILPFNLDIPQHYGVPTRFLDWTKNSYRALFFAAYHYLKKDEEEREKIKNIALFAIRQIDSRAIRFIANHSRYDNKFLHAQDGIFTRITGDFYFWEKGQWPSVEDINEVLKEEEKKSFELEINCIHPHLAWKILEKLDCAGITISAMMPDYAHVAEHVQFNLKYCQPVRTRALSESSSILSEVKVEIEN